MSLSDAAPAAGGWFDIEPPGIVRGWVSGGPGDSVRVEVWEGGKLVKAGPSDKSKADGEQDRNGGRCAFSVDMTSELADGRVHVLEVRVPELDITLPQKRSFRAVPTRGERELPPAALVITESAQPTPSEVAASITPRPMLPPTASEPASPAAPKAMQAPTAQPSLSPVLTQARKQPDIRGRLDAVVNGRAEGWAIDQSDPGKRVLIEIWEAEKLLAAGEASRERDDLRKAKIGDGRCSFSIALPRSVADGAKHEIRAKVAGTAHLLDGRASFTAPAATVRGRIEGLEGLTLRGWVSSTGDEPMTLDVVSGGTNAAEIDIPSLLPGERFPIATSLPIAFADGNVHWFQLKVRSSGVVIGQIVTAMPVVSTPEVALQDYAQHFPGFLSNNAAMRYVALERQIATAARKPPEQIPVYLHQIDAAHQQVKKGIKEQTGTPPSFCFPSHETIEASIVIPVHNKFWVTYNCLAALLLADNATRFEVIIVDDGSTDLTMQLGDIVAGITVLRNDTSLGFVKSSNRGARAARGEYVVMLNNDTEPCAGWLDELVHVFENFPDVGLAGAKFIYPDGRLQEAGGIVFPNLNVWNYGRNGNAFEPRYNYTRQVDYVSGACIMLRNSLWKELQGFDELFAPAYYEDNDLAFRVRTKGLKTYYTPFAKIVHFEGVSSGTSLGAGTKRYQAINQPKFRGRWAPVLRTYPTTLDPDLAKDRGVALRALMIDAQVPQPDKDAGSYAAIQEMRLLQALGFKVTFAPTNLAYLGNYTERLQKSGVECVYAPFQTSIEQLIEERGLEFDVFYITRYSIADQYVGLIRSVAPHAKIIFNNADLHFLRQIRAALASNDPEAMPDAVRTREVELAVMRRTDLTLSYTDTEAAVIVSHNLDDTKVARCPWVVDVAETIPPFSARTGLAFLGSYQHPPNEEAVRYFASQIMPALRHEIPGIVLRVYGSGMHAGLKDLESEDVLIEGYVKDVAEVYHSCRVFVAPLRSGAGIKGKVIGALAAGTPTVMTSLAAEGIGVSRGTEAVIADSIPEWIAAVKMLYNDEKSWTAMSNHAQQFAGRNYSFSAGLEKMRTALSMAGIYVN